MKLQNSEFRKLQNSFRKLDRETSEFRNFRIQNWETGFQNRETGILEVIHSFVSLIMPLTTRNGHTTSNHYNQKPNPKLKTGPGNYN